MGGLPRAADHRHRALPPRRGGPEVRRLAQQHVQPPRPRRRPRPRPRGARLRPPAPRAAAAARGLGELALRRRPRLGAALGAHADLHQELPALRRARRVRRLARYRDYIELLVRTRSIVEYTQVWWSVRPHFASAPSRCASATRRHRQESEGLAALIVACVAQAARDVDEGVPFEDPPPRLIEENMWRAIRYGQDGRMIDLRARRGVPVAARRSSAWPRGPRRCARSSASIRRSPSTTARSASVACSTPAPRCEEVYAATVRETRQSYPQEVTV